MAKPKQTSTQASKQAATQTRTRQAIAPSKASANRQATNKKKPAFGLDISSDDVQSQLNVDMLGFANHRYRQLVSVAWFRNEDSPERANERVVDAIRLYESLEPQDAIEAMLCGHMVGNTLAINECFQRAGNCQHIDNSVKFLKSASQLQGQFIKQVAALDKHRGRNHQKVVVEHVHVEAGGQAIVGNVETTAANQTKNESEQ